MKYIKLSEQKPNLKEHGEKVLIWRIMNKEQRDQNPSIYPVSMIRLCNPNETWWCKLPDEPTNDCNKINIIYPPCC